MKLEWKEIIYKNLPTKMLAVVPSDIDQYCINFANLTLDQRRNFYVNLFTELCRFESGFDPKCTYKESFNDAKGKPVVSCGLFQVSVESLAGYNFKVTQEQLFDPETNIKAMLAIASKWIIQDGCISSDKSPWRGLARYWSPFRAALKKEQIRKATLAVNYGENVNIYDQFYAMAKTQMGIHEIPGSKQEKKILEYHQATSLKATDEETPWCSSFANWVVKQCGVEGTNSAAARSWMKWGRELKQPVKGCIVVFSRTGGGHVSFFDSQDKDFIYCLGGNQSDGVNISAYRKDRLLGFRGVA